MKACAVILGGGSGTRMGAKQNKIFLPLRGVPAIVRAAAPFTGLCAEAVVVARPEELEDMRALLRRYGLDSFVKKVVPGGSTRQESVRHGLDALPGDTDIVLIHDGARALVTEDVIRRALETLNRDELRAMQTPQAFRLALLRQAHEKAEKDGFLGTDDAALLEHAGLPVYLTLGDPENLKLTTPADLALGEAILTLRREKEALS